MKKASLRKLSFNKLTISKLTNSDKIVGGSGICGGRSRPLNNCPPTNQINGC
ncbi:MAG: hypothetical protein ACI9Y7_002051 [Dokdonia sp.]|jgi:hypothetical protein